MTIVSDATALILLSKIDIIQIFVTRNVIIIPNTVYEEVLKGKEKFRADSFIVESLVKEKKLIIKNPDKQTKEKIQDYFNIKGGELEVISLAYAKKFIVLSDDKKCLNVAKALNIKFITSLDVVIALYKNGIIKKEVSLECIEKLNEYGWYSIDLIKKYKEEIK